MSALYKVIVDCIMSNSGESDYQAYTVDGHSPVAKAEQCSPEEQRLVHDIVDTLLYTEKTGKQCTNAYSQLAALEKAIEGGANMGSTMKQAYDKARAVATDFVQKHPILAAAMVTLVAIGILALLAPYIVEALGFGELGPVAGSWAARWQSSFGNVPEDSFFSWLQRLGMLGGTKPYGTYESLL